MALLDFYGNQTPAYLGGLLGDTELKALQERAGQDQLLSMAQALYKAGGPSRYPVSTGAVIAEGLQAGKQAYRDALNEGLKEKLTAMQLGEQMRKLKESENMRQMFPQIFNIKETPAVTEQNWSGAPEQIQDYFATGAIPQKLITPAQRSMSVDTNKLQALAAMSSDPLTALSSMAKMVPDLRKAGFIGAGEQKENPFLIFAQDPTIPLPIRQVAANYAKSYDSGLIDQETADKRLENLGNRVQSAQQFAQTQAGLEQGRAQTAAIAQQNADLRKQIEANKPEQLSYTQKKDFDVVSASKANAQQAEANASIANRASALLDEAYTGRLEAGVKGALGAVGFSTDAKTANDSLVRLSNQLAVNAPKFSGPTSDRDAARYDAAVGDLANPSKTLESKKQALKDIKELSRKAKSYAEQQENWFYNNNKSLRGFKFEDNPYDGM